MIIEIKTSDFKSELVSFNQEIEAQTSTIATHDSYYADGIDSDSTEGHEYFYCNGYRKGARRLAIRKQRIGIYALI